MRRFLFVFVLLASSTALDAAFAKGGVVHLFAASKPSASQLPSPSEFLAAAMAATSDLGHQRRFKRKSRRSVGAVAASPQRLIFGDARTIDAICTRLGKCPRQFR
jgi:hypothetical protein